MGWKIENKSIAMTGWKLLHHLMHKGLWNDYGFECGYFGSEFVAWFLYFR
jgi:hypothetical protein